MTDITFVNLPSTYLEDAMWIYPLGLVGLVTYTRSLGIRAELLDLAILPDYSNVSVLRELRKIKSPVIGVSVVTPNVKYLPLFLSLNAKLIAGGPHASCVPDELMELGFQTVVVGEGEPCIENCLRNDERKCEGVVEDLDSLPFPDRSLVKGYKGPTPVMTSRSCPYRCTFCSTSETKYRQRSPENVVEEIQSIEADQIIFYDDTLTAKKPWIERLCNLIKSHNIKKRFRCSTRADKVDLDLLSLMKSAGFEEICVGIESGSQKILDVLNKKTKVETNTRARKLAARTGIKFKAYIMLGSPGESLETIEETKHWLRSDKPDSVGLYMFHPMPGSDIWKHPEKYDIQFSRDYDSSFYGGKRREMCSTVSTSFLSNQQITQSYWDLMKELNL
jgi:radical SAM superfamily enzyme YgiQ (UPF0313 family)